MEEARGEIPPVYERPPMAPIYEPPKPKRSRLAKFKGLNKWWHESRVYLAEYAVLLIVTGSLLGIIMTQFNTVIDYIGGDKPVASWASGFAYTASIAMLAAVIVLVPIFWLLTKRTKGSEAHDAKIKNGGWRKAFLAIFLVIVALNAIGFGIALVYELLSRLVSIGLSTGEKPVIWKTLVKDIFAVLLFGSTAWLYGRDYRNQASSTVKSWAKRLHNYALAGLTLALSVIFVVVPLRYQRHSFIDHAIVNDLNAIELKVEDYARSKGKLPKALDDLDLSKQIRAHAKSYGYRYEAKDSSTYELCAVFKTSTKDNNKPSGNVLDQYLSGSYGSYSDSYSRRNDNPARHGKGLQCFTFESYSNYRQYDDYPSLFDDQPVEDSEYQTDY